MKFIIFAATLLMAQQAGAAPCNRDAALEIQTGLREFVREHVEGDHIAAHWIYSIEKQPEAKRLQMVTTYANMDACLSGATREIMFYRKGRIMGIASPTSGIRLVK